MATGPRAHEAAESTLSVAGGGVRVVTSAGALVDGARTLGARRVALVAPYLPALTDCVVDYLAGYGVEVVDAISLSVADNAAVGRLVPTDLVAIADQLDVSRADAVVLSACVQMPSLAAVPVVEARLGLPVFSAAIATTRRLLDTFGLSPDMAGAGALLRS